MLSSAGRWMTCLEDEPVERVRDSGSLGLGESASHFSGLTQLESEASRQSVAPARTQVLAVEPGSIGSRGRDFEPPLLALDGGPNDYVIAVHRVVFLDDDPVVSGAISGWRKGIGRRDCGSIE